jgi:hypothetical protein
MHKDENRAAAVAAVLAEHQKLTGVYLWALAAEASPECLARLATMLRLVSIDLAATQAIQYL